MRIHPSEEEFAKAIKMVSGDPTDEELAAVIAVVQEAIKQQGAAISQPRSRWAMNSSLLRTDLIVGHGQWQSSYRSGL